ncbi:MAG: biotin transporter BioY [Bacteroidota bacterium]
MLIKENAKSNTLIEILSKVRNSQIFWIVTFSFLTFLGAQVTIPTQPVPFTLQTMIVLLSGAFLGSRNGALSQITYLLAGSLGLPIFAEYSFGFAKLFGPTGGYLLAFPIAAYITGLIIENKRSTLRIGIGMILGSLIILLSGSLFLSLFMNGNIKNALFSGAIIFSVWDVIKISASISIYKAFSKKFPRLP